MNWCLRSVAFYWCNKRMYRCDCACVPVHCAGCGLITWTSSLQWQWNNGSLFCSHCHWHWWRRERRESACDTINALKKSVRPQDSWHKCSSSPPWERAKGRGYEKRMKAFVLMFTVEYPLTQLLSVAQVNFQKYAIHLLRAHHWVKVSLSLTVQWMFFFLFLSNHLHRLHCAVTIS